MTRFIITFETIICTEKEIVAMDDVLEVLLISPDPLLTILVNYIKMKNPTRKAYYEKKVTFYLPCIFFIAAQLFHIICTKHY